MKYRTKPVIVDAVKWKGNNKTEVELFLKENTKEVKIEDWAEDCLIINGLLCIKDNWILVKSNQILFCEPTSFEKVYEPYDASNELEKILIHRFHRT